MDIIERAPEQWQQILEACGVRAGAAAKHAPAFAAQLVPGALSGGEEELDDFLGQVLHESGMLEAMRENMNYSADGIRRVGFAQPAGSRWRAAAERAEQLARKPEALANCVYSNRLGNGDEASGDGWRFRGGGHIQITGRGAYEKLGDVLGVDLGGQPELIEDPETALRATVAWWEGNIPDSCLNDIVKVTKRVNGGTLGIQHRIEITEAARAALAGA